MLNDTLYGVASQTSNSVSFTLGDYSGGDKVSSVTIKNSSDSKTIYDSSKWTFDPASAAQTGTFNFTIPYSMASGTYDVIFKMSDGKEYTCKSALVVYDGTDIGFSGLVYVNEDKKINLNAFTTPTSGMEKGVSVSGTAADNVTVNNGNAGSIQNVTITGKKATNVNSTTGVEKITIENFSGTDTTQNVTVYPKPSLELSGTSKLTVTMPYGVYYTGVELPELKQAVLEFKGSDGTETTDPFTMGSADSYKLSKTKDITLNKSSSSSSSSSSSDDINLISILREVCSGSDDTVYVKAYAYNKKKDTNIVSEDDVSFKVYKITLDGNATYKVNGQEVSGYFYAIKNSSPTISISGTGTLDKDNSSPEFANSTSITLSGVAGVRTLKANYNSGSSANSTTGRNSATAGDMDDYDDVPKTGESKADIWILWSVLFVSILGAGFMIWKRFGLVRAIAEADEEVAVAEHKEEVKARKKEKEDKLKMLKDLRNL